MPITELLEKNCQLYGDEVCLVELNPEIKDFYQFTSDDVRLDNYVTGPQIKNIPVAI